MAAPLKTHERNYVIQLLSLGNTKAEIVAKFEAKYHRSIHHTTISRLKSKNAPAISEAHEIIAGGSEIIGANVLKQKTYRLMDRKLDRALEDDDQMALLRQQLKAGEIDQEFFNTEAAKLEKISIRELTAIADSMHTHAKQGDEEPALSAADQAALTLLMQGINSGNPMTLVQVLNPSLKIDRPIVESPAPPEDTPDPDPAPWPSR